MSAVSCYCGSPCSLGKMGPRDLNNSLATDQVAINPMDNHDHMT